MWVSAGITWALILLAVAAFAAWRFLPDPRWKNVALGLGIGIAVAIGAQGIPPVENAFAPGSEWFWAMAQVVIVGASLVFIGWQLHLQRESTMQMTLADLRTRWNAKEMRDCRRHICDPAADTETRIGQIEETVLGFFEEMGYNLRRHVYSVDVLWEKYSYIIEHYWPILRPRVTKIRQDRKDRSFFEHFEYLHGRLVKFSLARGLPVVTPSDADLARFKSSELEVLREKQKIANPPEGEQKTRR